jgi:hypothetical protein
LLLGEDKNDYLMLVIDIRPRWGFYGRKSEAEKLRAILARGRWFFLKITGRRRIGKTNSSSRL